MKAVWSNLVIAEADKDELVRIEGNWYFPPDSINKKYFTTTDTHSVCFWKGLASYYDLAANGTTNKKGAWYYPKPTALSKKLVRKDFTNYVAFWPNVTVEE